MTRSKKLLLAGFVSGTFLLLAGESFAQDAAPAAASDATIRVRPGPVRTTLIRPRTSFVPEMLKSVENI
jgi:hypothetical protein